MSSEQCKKSSMSIYPVSSAHSPIYPFTLIVSCKICSEEWNMFLILPWFLHVFSYQNNSNNNKSFNFCTYCFFPKARNLISRKKIIFEQVNYTIPLNICRLTSFDCNCFKIFRKPVPFWRFWAKKFINALLKF